MAQLRRKPEHLHIYLDAIFDFDPQISNEYHDMQVELYAEFDYSRLMHFLRASSYYSLEKALAICEKRNLVMEMVFILGRIGDNHRALMLIIERLGDVYQAIEFAKDQQDESLWEDLINYSKDKPGICIVLTVDFIKGLLENAGSHIDPVKLVQCITEGLEIPGLKAALLKILSDLSLQVYLIINRQTTLREGCQKILAQDTILLTGDLMHQQKRGIKMQGFYFYS